LAALGIDLTEVGEVLQTDGVRLFAEAYKKIMTSLQAPSKD
jgi:transaldolase